MTLTARSPANPWRHALDLLVPPVHEPTELELDWRRWLPAMFPSLFVASFADHHAEFWRWVWAMRADEKPPPFVGIWGRGGAKALAVETPIPTPDGWVTMGEIVPGMVVFDHAGTAVRVTGVGPITEQECSRVGFRSGGSIVASADHLWAVAGRETRRAWRLGIPSNWPTWTGHRAPRAAGLCPVPGCTASSPPLGLCSAHAERMRRFGDVRADVPVVAKTSRGVRAEVATEVLTTASLLAAGLESQAERAWAIPVAAPLELPEQLLPVDPYLLGAWLGDGTSANGNITVGFDDSEAMGDLLSLCGHELVWHRRPGSMVVNVVGLNTMLKGMGLRDAKQVPAAYLRAGVKQRLALLQGLMDTDGTHARDKARATFTSTRYALASAVAELARSLGLRVNITEGRACLAGRDCGPKWLVGIASTDLPLFRLPRKMAIQESIKRQRLVGSMHYIDSIEPAGSQLARCITVDSPGRCFLAGESMIPTHNSTSAEAACVAIAARKVRRYGLYLGASQDKADDHVANIAAMLESPQIERMYPELAARSVGKYGHSRGWRRNRLRTASGFTIDAIGLDSAARGAKLEDARPDLLVIDDVDDDQDSPAAVAKKIKLLTRKVLPAGANNLAVLAIQNLIHENSIFSQLAVPSAAGGASFLADRIVSGPVPAVRDLTVEQIGDRWTIIGGEATWDGQSIETCQAQIGEWGISAFLSEAQHDVQAPPGGMYDHLSYAHVEPGLVPDLVRVVVWVDPAVTDTDDSDACGIQADGISSSGTIYRLRSWEQRATPQVAMRKALSWAIDLGADHVGVETDQGGETWNSVYAEACRDVEAELRRRPGGWTGTVPAFTYAKAGAGHGSKTHRSAQMLADYERPGRIVHVLGTHLVLERALNRFPKTPPLDLCDAAYWSFWDLRNGSTGGMTTYRHEGARR